MNFYFIEKTRVVNCGPPAVKRIFRAAAAYHPIPELKSAIPDDGQRVKKNRRYGGHRTERFLSGHRFSDALNSVGEDG